MIGRHRRGRRRLGQDEWLETGRSGIIRNSIIQLGRWENEEMHYKTAKMKPDDRNNDYNAMLAPWHVWTTFGPSRDCSCSQCEFEFGSFHCHCRKESHVASCTRCRFNNNCSGNRTQHCLRILKASARGHNPVKLAQTTQGKSEPHSLAQVSNHCIPCKKKTNKGKWGLLLFGLLWFLLASYCGPRRPEADTCSHFGWLSFQLWRVESGQSLAEQLFRRFLFSGCRSSRACQKGLSPRRLQLSISKDSPCGRLGQRKRFAFRNARDPRI